MPRTRALRRLALPRALRRLALPRALCRVLALAPALALALSLPVTPAHAGGTKTIDLADFDDFDDGEVDGAAIEGSGRVTVGYRPQRAEVTGASAFVCHVSGKQAYVGTADAATIQAVKHQPAKKSAAKKDGKADDKKADKKPESDMRLDKVAELPGVVVTAIADGPGGDLLAATLPGGVIHRVNAKGQVSEFAKLDVTQIWAIVPHKGRYLVATGPKGELYSLDQKGGDAKVLLDSEEKDLLSVLTHGDAILVGTSPGAKLLQVTSDLEGVLLHDFPGDEIRDLALTDRGLLAAVNSFSDRGISSLDALTKNLARTSLVGQPAEGSSESRQRSVKASAELYHVLLGKGLDLGRASEATWESWLSKEKQYFTDLLVVDGATALVSSSYDGKIYRVRGRRDKATVADFDERQATGLCAMSDGTAYATTGDGAALYRLDTRPAVSAKYRSKVFDQKQPASYGAIIVRGTGPLAVRARVGPSDEPDKRWSEWKKITLTRASDGLRGELELPRRRYLQLEVDLEGQGAELRSLEAFYAPENLPPLVKAVEFTRPEGDDDEEPDAKVTIKWKAEATDDDDLVYEVRVRPEGGSEREWVKLHGDSPVTKKELKWDLGSVPDGLYEVEVVASDEPANGSARAESDALISAPFIVDRTRPTVKGVKVSPREITGIAEDDGGYVHDVAFSIDGKPFRAASPADGLFDSHKEGFVIAVPDDLEKGRHRVVLRARDSFGNLGTIAVFLER